MARGVRWSAARAAWAIKIDSITAPIHLLMPIRTPHLIRCERISDRKTVRYVHGFFAPRSLSCGSRKGKTASDRGDHQRILCAACRARRVQFDLSFRRGGCECLFWVAGSWHDDV